MPISGLVIQVEPGQNEAVLASLASIENLEIPATPPGEKLVAVLDVPSIAAEEAIFKQINEIEGVSNVSLSYHNFEDIS